MDQEVISDTEKSPLVEILIWMLLSISIMAIIARIVTRVTYVREFKLDDVFIIFSAVLAIAQSTAMWLSTKEGFGSISDTPSWSQTQALLKSEYAANMLHIAVLCLTKLSILSLIRSLTAVRLHRQLVLALEALVVLWAFSAEVCVAFLCQLPTPWDYTQSTCFNRQVTFWKYFATTNIITDAAQIILVAVAIIAYIKTSFKRRVTLSLVFGVRTLVIIITILQIVLLNQVSTSQNPTFDLWPFAIVTQTLQCISIVTACVPYLKPFLKSLESGLLRADDLHGFGMTNMDSRNRAVLGSKGKSLAISKSSSTPSQGNELEASTLVLRPQPQYTTSTAAGGGDPGWDRQSQSSQTKIITETRSWAVNVEGGAQE